MNEDKPNMNRILIAGTRKTVSEASKLLISATLIPFPLLDTEVLDGVIFSHTEYDWIVFTSPAAVKHFYNLVNKPSFKKIAAVGPSTKKTAERYKFTINFMPEEYNADCFGKTLIKKLGQNAKVLFPCSILADDTLEKQLKLNNISCERVNLYSPATLTKPELPEFDCIAFLSGSSAEAMYKHFGSQVIQGKKIAAIGNKAAKKVKELFGVEPLVPQSSTAENTINELL